MAYPNMNDIVDFLATHKPSRQSLELEVVRELAQEDIDMLQQPAALPQSSLEHIRAIHHVQARLVAEGKSPSVVAAIVGSSVNRVKAMLQDPAFQELVAYYTDQKDVLWLETQQMLSLLGRSAAQELQRRLDEKPEGFSNNELRNVMESALDRSDAPDKSKDAPSITVSFVKPQGPIIDVTPDQ